MVASGLTLTLGVIKVFNFAQGHFYMLGAFLTFAVAVSFGLPYPVAILAALVSMAILGVLLYFGIIQKTIPQGFFSTMLATVMFATLINQVSLLTFAYKERSIPAVFPGTLNISEVSLSWGRLFVIACAIALMLALYYFMKTKIGTAMLAAAENSEVASLQGVNAKQIFWVTMAVGCGLSGIAGAIIAPIQGAYLVMGQNIFLRALLVVLVGGMGSMSGALIAGFLIGILESFTFQYLGYLNMIAILVGVGILVFFRPGGLLGKPLPVPGE